ncbi:MAG TPA: HDIG domain-containing protein [Acidobacteriota bacterium]|nr:HDIG domain-containing protein [Acidobacteriota bacterium]HQF86675.1 HDIG domain-containing protein [Acidobacteriota bacterium]HQG90073.1 HDIG domain-containing protein [Acidobacteriota bacterium]
MTRDDALVLLHEWTQKDGLRKHAYGVEAAMRAYARRFGEDADIWGVVGLLHDFDYERYPDADNHPFRGAEELRRLGMEETLVRAILAHASYTGVPRDTLVAKALFAVDELVGLITAAALVTPDKKLAAVGVRSVIKKMKDKAFARAVNRDEIRLGAEELGVPLEEHIGVVLAAMQANAAELGL